MLSRAPKPHLLAASVLCCAEVLFGAGCKGAPDVVAAPIAMEAGTLGDAAAKGAKHDAATPVDPCDPAQRLERSHVPTFALDLILDCEAKFSTLGFGPPSGDAGTKLSPDEFSKLITAPMLKAIGDVSGAALCAGQDNGGWYFAPLANPDRVVLCPTSCELFRRQVQLVLSKDGCDGAFDAGSLQPGSANADGQDAGHS